MSDQSQFGNEYRGTGTGTTQGATDAARQTANQAKEQAKEAVGQVADKAKQQATSRLATQKDNAAQSLGDVAQALRTTGQQLRDQDQMGVTGYIDQIADQVERFSGYIGQRDVSELVGDVERFARRQPGLFLGGAFVLGLLGARFLKSSAPQPRYQYQNQYYQGSRYPMTRYEDDYPLYETNREYQRQVGGVPGVYDRSPTIGSGTEEL